MLHRSLFNDVSMFHSELEKIFSGYGLSHLSARDSDASSGAVRPRLNLYMTDTGYLLELPLTDIDEDSIDISLAGNVLTLSAETAVGRQVETGTQWHRRERRVGKYARQVELPDDIDSSKVHAEYRDGILRITLPKAEAALPNKISVQVN